MGISFIVALDRNGLMGNESGLPWRLPADLRRFRKLTMGHPIIMGRKTFDHIGKPLDGRLNIVLTRDRNFRPGCVVAHSLDVAIELAREAAPPIRTGEIFVIGGADIFQQSLPIVDRVYLTIVEGLFSGNAWFPFDPPFTGKISHQESHPADAKNPHAHRFLILDRAAEGVTIRELLAV